MPAQTRSSSSTPASSTLRKIYFAMGIGGASIASVGILAMFSDSLANTTADSYIRDRMAASASGNENPPLFSDILELCRQNGVRDRGGCIETETGPRSSDPGIQIRMSEAGVSSDAQIFSANESEKLSFGQISEQAVVDRCSVQADKGTTYFNRCLEGLAVDYYGFAP